jgi:hypothetical protein
MTQFQVSTGALSINGEYIGNGYSGAPGHVDAGADETLVGEGPIPTGSWGIGQPIDSAATGPFSLPLTPGAETNTFGRSGFLIHGDNPQGNHSASHGCIVAARTLREQIDADPDRLLNVVA